MTEYRYEQRREEIPPALTPEEWAERLDPANAEWAPLAYHNRSAHASAASNLYGQPFGFDWSDVDAIRALVDWVEAVHPLDAPERATSTAERIAALLPPRVADREES